MLASKQDFGLGKTYLNYAHETAAEKNEYKKPKLRNQTAKRILGDAFSNSSNRISIDMHRSKESAERKALTSNRMYKEASSQISSEPHTHELEALQPAAEADPKNNIDLLSSDKRFAEVSAEQKPELDKLTYKPSLDIDSLLSKRHTRRPRKRLPEPDLCQEQSSGSQPKTEEKKMNSNLKTSQPQPARLVPNWLTRGPDLEDNRASPFLAKATQLRNPLHHKHVPRLEVARVPVSPSDPNDPNAPPETSETVKCIEFEVDRMIGESRSRSQNRGKHR